MMRIGVIVNPSHMGVERRIVRNDGECAFVGSKPWFASEQLGLSSSDAVGRDGPQSGHFCAHWRICWASSKRAHRADLDDVERSGA